LVEGRTGVEAWAAARWSAASSSNSSSSSNNKTDWWCVKAARGNGGGDVFMLHAGNAAAATAALPAEAGRTYVLQRYIAEPLLRNGCKFHFRAFALLRGDLKSWLYRGSCLLCASKEYALHSAEDCLMHLTNLSVQKGVTGHTPQVSLVSQIASLAAETAKVKLFSAVC
jgi:Tubulin-tyrosine ligase family